jgi:fatty acid desaturase
LEIGLTLFLALMLVIGGLYSLIVLIIGIFRKKPVQSTAMEVVKLDEEDRKIRKWRTGALLLVLLTLLNTLLLVWAGLSFMPKNFFYVIIAIYIVLLVLSVLHLIQLIRMKPANTKNTRKQIAFPTFLLIVTIVSIIFFQFYQFWNL